MHDASTSSSTRPAAAIIHLPADLPRLRAGIDAVRARAAALDASPHALRRALQVLLAELQAGRSSGAAVALANSTLSPTPRRWIQPGGAA